VHAEDQSFECPKARQLVQITLTKHDFAKELGKPIGSHAVTAFYCSHYMLCGVLDIDGETDWNRCVHPEVKRALQ